MEGLGLSSLVSDKRQAALSLITDRPHSTLEVLVQFRITSDQRGDCGEVQEVNGGKKFDQTPAICPIFSRSYRGSQCIDFSQYDKMHFSSDRDK